MNDCNKVISFDIFDTLLFRLVRKPEDVFGIMYEKNKETLGRLFSRKGWVKFRKEMEREAEQRRVAPTIFEIYEEGKGVIAGIPELIESEFSCECEVCYINKDIESQIHYERESGNKVILVSDMYWPLPYMRKLLKACGFNSEVDEIFVSCEYRCSKEDGKLYEKVLEKMSVDPETVTHIGDSLKADYINAKRKRLNAGLIELTGFKYLKYPFLELEKQNDDCLNLESLRLLACNKNGTIDDEWFAIGSMIYGPFVVGAIDDLIDTAIDQGIRRIFPFMREGEFFSIVLNRMLESRGLSLDVSELYVSRSALDGALQNEDSGRNAIRYFEKKGLSEPFITFDIGYAGTTGTLLDNLLDKYGINNKRIHYLGIQWEKSIRNVLGGHSIRGYIHAEDKWEWKDIKAWILEMSFMSQKGRTSGYGVDGAPILEKVKYSSEQVAASERCQQGILAFVNIFCEVRKKKELRINPSECHEILSRFFQNPLLYETNAVKKIEYDEDYFDNFCWTVIDDERVERFRRKGFASFEFSDDQRAGEWIPGIYSLINPIHSFCNVMYQRLDYARIECICWMERYLKSLDTTEEFLLVGFGFWGQEVLKGLKILGENGRVKAIVDNESSLQGVDICGFTIVSMIATMNYNCKRYLITVQNRDARLDLQKQIHAMKYDSLVSFLWE